MGKINVEVTCVPVYCCEDPIPFFHYLLGDHQRKWRIGRVCIWSCHLFYYMTKNLHKIPLYWITWINISMNNKEKNYMALVLDIIFKKKKKYNVLVLDSWYNLTKKSFFLKLQYNNNNNIIIIIIETYTVK